MKNNLIYIICFILIVFTSCTTGDTNNETAKPQEIAPAPPPDSIAFFDSLYAPLSITLDTFFLNKHLRTEFYGTVLFAERGRIIFENAYGYADLKTKDTLTLDHTFQLASASKPFTAVAIMQLIEQGKINLDDDVQSYIPYFPYSGITIHHLLSHRSGLSQYTHFCDAPDSIWADKHKTITNNDVLEIMALHIPMINYAPDQTFYYCNTNYMLLASIVEIASGLPFKEYLKHNVFDKAGMKSTVLYHRDNKEELILPAQGYNGAFNPVLDIYLNGVVGDKGIYSNVHDLLAFDNALYDGSLVSDSSIALMMQEHNKTKNDGKNYGYGFRMYPAFESGKIVFHTGWWKGFRTYFIRIPDKQQTIIVLSNIKRGKFLNVKELAKLLN